MDERKKTSFQASHLDYKSPAASERSSSTQKTPTFEKISVNDSRQDKRPAMNHRKSLPTAAFRRPSNIDGKQGHKLSTTSQMRKDSRMELPERRDSKYRRDSKLELGSYRRKSVWERLNPGSRALASSTTSTKNSIKFQNSYVIDTPEGKGKFNPNLVEPMLHRILESLLNEETYNATKCHSLVTMVSDNIKDQLKALEFSERYRYVCWVSISEAAGQSMEVASRCLWSPGVDHEVSVSYVNQRLKLMAFATVFAIHLE